MTDTWLTDVPELEAFAQAADPGMYASVPNDWLVGVTDVVESTTAIARGEYKQVNLAGAAAISAVSNALEGDLPLFVFAGDGARFVVPPEHEAVVRDALARVGAWVERDLGLRLRVGMVDVAAIRVEAADVRAAFWRASENVRYAMFTGGGFELAEAWLKRGSISIDTGEVDGDPDLSGLSCQWGPLSARNGKIVSMIVKRASGCDDESFAAVAAQVVAVVEAKGSANPVPVDGPAVAWPSGALPLQAKVAHEGHPVWRRWLRVASKGLLAWAVFKSGARIRGFDANRYRSEISANTDFRKFDDALMMTVDCDEDTIRQLRSVLEAAYDEGLIRFGLHLQDQALMTCVVPSVMSADHMHFVDGADGGYAAAAAHLFGRS